MDTKKMGRPTDNPKDKSLRVRVDKTTLEKLDICSKKLEISRSEVIRQSISNTYDDLEK